MVEDGRYTPACAGKIKTMTMNGGLSSVHPRVCGEDILRLSRYTPAVGTPPRVRGRCRHGHMMVRMIRYTPACAGKIGPPRNPSSPLAVHPRVCGEDLLLNFIRLRVHGTPPRVRGRSMRRRSCVDSYRYTPACAGKICAPGRSRRPGPVHPRVCGEDGFKVDQPRGIFGTPPRVRGRSRRDRPDQRA